MSGLSKQSFIQTASDEQLLGTRLCDFTICLSGSFVESCIDELYKELAQKKLWFRPKVWVSTEWFCPYGVAGFAIPFYLLHPRLMELEKRLMGEAEGESVAACMQLLRHETGHAIDNAFGLRRYKRRQKLFGLSGKPYPKYYSPQPYSRQYVKHLKNHYAQAHPDEDWAETFAVWLNSKIEWKTAYANQGAVKKLELLDEMMLMIASQKPSHTLVEIVEPISSCKLTLGDYFAQKQRRFGTGSFKRISHKIAM